MKTREARTRDWGTNGEKKDNLTKSERERQGLIN